MPMSDDERRELRDLEDELAPQRRLVRLARQLDSATVYTGFRRITVLWIAGGLVGLILVIAGIAIHSTGLLIAAVTVLTGTAITVGAALIVVQMAGIRAEQRSLRPPSSQ